MLVRIHDTEIDKDSGFLEDKVLGLKKMHRAMLTYKLAKRTGQKVS